VDEIDQPACCGPGFPRGSAFRVRTSDAA
jgi:hypothetical protein